MLTVAYCIILSAGIPILFKYSHVTNVSPAAAFVVFSTVSLAAAISIYKTSNPDDNKDED